MAYYLKLTPMECFRLIGVGEADIDKIQSGGVSIRKAFVEPGPDARKGELVRLSLF